VIAPLCRPWSGFRHPADHAVGHVGEGPFDPDCGRPAQRL